PVLAEHDARQAVGRVRVFGGQMAPEGLAVDRMDLDRIAHREPLRELSSEYRQLRLVVDRTSESWGNRKDHRARLHPPRVRGDDDPAPALVDGPYRGVQDDVFGADPVHQAVGDQLAAPSDPVLLRPTSD